MTDQSAHALWRSIHQSIRSDVLGGVLLLGATVAALMLANSPAADGYRAVRDATFGIPALRLELSVGAWAADGLLAVFFFVVGLELKEELVVGRLRDPRAAAVPVAAAFGGVIVPAAIFVIMNADAGARGWAVPTATDIAFAVAVLAIAGRFLPPSLRVFLLTLAIVDDLVAITIIATVYTASIELVWLAFAVIPLGLFAWATQRGVRAWWMLLPLAIATWALVHASGVHATVAGVVLGFVVPVVARRRARVRAGVDGAGRPVYDGMTAHFADGWGPVATLVALPVFAFFSAGVTLGGLGSALADPITLGVMAGLVLGKPIGILGATFLATGVPGMRIDPTLRWGDLVGMAFVAGIGFTVSLLIGELSYGPGESGEHVKVGVLLGSLIAALLGGAILSIRSRAARRGLA